MEHLCAMPTHCPSRSTQELGAHFTLETKAPWTVLLAGGEGRRLSSIVRRIHPDGLPKQFATLIGSRSMLQHTHHRARRHSPPEKILVSITEGQQRWAIPQLPDVPTRNFMVQPRNLDTGPAIALAIAGIMAVDPMGTVLLLPADHFVFPEEELEGHIGRILSGVDTLHDMECVLLGAEPSEPCEGMGWIVPGNGKGGEADFHQVRSFVEKPARRDVQRLYEGGALWNTSMVAAPVRTFWCLLWKHWQDVMRRIEQTVRCMDFEGMRTSLETLYGGLEPLNFSSDLLAHIPEYLLVSPLTRMNWRDWGTSEGFFETIESMGWIGRVDEKVSCGELRAPAASSQGGIHGWT